MDLSKSIPSKYVLGITIIVLAIGIGIGAIIGDVPLIKFETDVDLATCIAVIGFFATVFYLPNIVQRKFTSIDNVNVIIRHDLESMIDDVAKLKDIFVSIKAGRRATQAQYVSILASFKLLSAAILDLNKELEIRGRLTGFKKDVYNEAFVVAKTTCTENIMIQGGLSQAELREATTSLNQLSAALKCYRYKAFSER